MEFSGGLHYWERASNAHADVHNQTTIYGTQGGRRFGSCFWDSPEIEFFSLADGGKGMPRRDTITLDMSQHQQKDNVALDKAWLDYLCQAGPVLMTLDHEWGNLAILHKVYEVAKWPQG